MNSSYLLLAIVFLLSLSCSCLGVMTRCDKEKNTDECRVTFTFIVALSIMFVVAVAAGLMTGPPA